MRTTLKRGIGRGAAVNGNGRAVLPPDVIAPATPITRYRQPVRERGFLQTVARALLWLLVAATTAAAGLLGGAYLYFHESVRDLKAHTPAVKIAQEKLDVPLPGAPAIALVVGYDQRAGNEAEITGARSDTIMLLRADPDLKAVSMLSFPRDLYVDVYCPGQGSFPERISAAYSACGPQGTLETVRNLTGLPINYLVTVNFHGFKQMVAKLGGVWMDVDRRYYNPPGTGYAAIDLQPGYQKLTGQEALDFVRYRHADSDLYRLARQQMFVGAFKQAFADSFSIPKVPQLVGVIKDNLEVGAKDGDIDGDTFISWGLLALDVPQGNFFQEKIDFACYGEDDLSAITVSKECVDQAVRAFASPDVEAAEKATVAALGLRPKSSAPPPSKTTLVVLNGNGVPGAAADASFQLTERGYQALPPQNGEDANAPTQSYARTQVYFSPVADQAELAANKVADLLGGKEAVDVATMPAELGPLAGESMLAVVLGLNFSGSVSPAPVDRTPERRPPDVVKNPDATRQLLRDQQTKVPFPLMVPAVIEKTSRVDWEVPLHVYDVAGRKTLRLTFVTGASEYWGIQMMRWNAAPAIRGANRKLHLKGRVYALHYTGSKLHMVVVRDRGTTYWVVNTLLNSLSNETMLEIAKGLQPLKAR
jgi:LCP family protein required for cell wall assembly